MASAPRIIGDRTRLMQILLNLSDNAIKFTDRGMVKISAAVKSREGGNITLEFRVSDTGKGIPEEKRRMIFERFTQESAETTRRYGGTGLGLIFSGSNLLKPLIPPIYIVPSLAR